MPHGSLEQDEAQLAVLHLLVNCHGVAELLNRHGLQGRGTVQPGQSHAFRRQTNKTIMLQKCSTSLPAGRRKPARPQAASLAPSLHKRCGHMSVLPSCTGGRCTPNWLAFPGSALL